MDSVFRVVTTPSVVLEPIKVVPVNIFIQQWMKSRYVMSYKFAFGAINPQKMITVQLPLHFFWFHTSNLTVLSHPHRSHQTAGFSSVKKLLETKTACLKQQIIKVNYEPLDSVAIFFCFDFLLSF